MNRFKFMLPALLAMTCALVAPAFAEDEVETVSAADNESPSLWFIEFAGAPLADGGKKADLQKARNAFAAAAKAAGAEYTKRFEFETLWNGISVRVSPANLSRIARLPEVANVWPVDTYSLPEPVEGSVPELAYALPMTGASIAQAAGFTGAGMKIGIIDTGIDIDHPDFGGTGVPGTTPFPNAKIIAGYDFVGDLYDANPANATYNPVPSPDPNPDDCGGHGSHVAGIAAANGVVKGVAPDARLGAYRVFGCNGSTDADIMIAAMERAYNDGMNVINMSIGSAFQTWPQYPTAAAGDRMVARGMVVVCSIGNSGANGQFSASAPGVGNAVIGTASFDNTNISQKAFMVDPGGILVGFGPATAAPIPPSSGSLPVGKTGTPASTNDGCPPWEAAFGGTPYAGGAWLAPGSMAGKAVLIRRGTCGFWHKAYNAQQAGAAAVILYNNTTGTINPTVAAPAAGLTAINIPVVAITAAAGTTINNLVAAGDTTLTWGDQTVVTASSTGGLISSFSSYGLNAELTVKPDIGAPGGNIWSTIPLELGAYGNNSGTSMASPHMAGMAALLRQAKPGLSAAAVRDVLMNSAEPRNWSGNPGLGFLDLVHRQGAGMGRIDRAIAATTIITPAKLSLGETEGAPVTKTLTFWNSAAAPVTYNLTHTAALATGPNNNTVSFFNAPSAVAFSSSSVMVPAGGSATVDVTVTANAGLTSNGYFGGYVVATPAGGGEALRVPYAGTKGDYQALTVLVPTGNNFPRLGVSVGGGSFGLPPLNTAWSYDMQNGNIPYILVHLEHPSRELRVEIFEAGSGMPVHPVFYQAFVESYLPRNSTATGFFALAWDGTRQHNNGKGNDFVKVVPNGDYILKLSVLKALGDRSNPAHWETWTSPVVTLARP